jgi:uncharacterized membrane protein
LSVPAIARLASRRLLVRHEHFGSGFDLGIFTQAVWHYSHFQAPASSIKGTANLLGDHFQPILILLAPLFWVWADARTLLIAQAVLVAASIVPVYLFAPAIGAPGGASAGSRPRPGAVRGRARGGRLDLDDQAYPRDSFTAH